MLALIKGLLARSVGPVKSAFHLPYSIINQVISHRNLSPSMAILSSKNGSCLECSFLCIKRVFCVLFAQDPFLVPIQFLASPREPHFLRKCPYPGPFPIGKSARNNEKSRFLLAEIMPENFSQIIFKCFWYEESY